MHEQCSLTSTRTVKKALIRTERTLRDGIPHAPAAQQVIIKAQLREGPERGGDLPFPVISRHDPACPAISRRFPPFPRYRPLRCSLWGLRLRRPVQARGVDSPCGCTIDFDWQTPEWTLKRLDCSKDIGDLWLRGLGAAFNEPKLRLIPAAS